MAKLIIFIAGLIVLLYPMEGQTLRCYHCIGGHHLSSRGEFNKLEKCHEDIEKSPVKDVTSDGSPECKKLVEKIKVSGKEETLIIRMYVEKKGPMNLDPNIFQEYSCNTDLCNAGTHLTATVSFVLFSIVTALCYNI